MLDWMSAHTDLSCVHNYTVQIRNDRTLEFYATTVTTALNVTGLAHGVEYTATVFGSYWDGRSGENARVNMTLDGTEFVVMNSNTVYVTSLSRLHTQGT